MSWDMPNLFFATMIGLGRRLGKSAVRLSAFVTLTFACPFAFATQTECEKALLAIQMHLGENITTENYGDVQGKDDEVIPTVQLESTHPGRHGGLLMVLHRTGARWLSNYKSVDYSPQGDPRWFIEVVGVEAAEFFGFKVLDNERVIVPDGQEFNGALQQINEVLKSRGKEPIAISFYVEPTEQNLKVAEYTLRFGENFALPLAHSSDHLVHDLSFHTGAIFLPTKLVRTKAFLTRYVNGFRAYLQDRFASDAAKLKASNYITYLFQIAETISIDAATAFVNPGIVASLRKPGDYKTLTMMYLPITVMSGDGHTPPTYLANRIESLEMTSQKFFDEYAKFANKEKLAESLEALPIPVLLKEFENYNHSSFVPHDFPIWRKVQVDPTEKIYDSFCKGISLRRLLVRQIALELKAAGT